MLKKHTPFGPLAVADAHVHFFSRNFFETIAGQSPLLSKEADPVARAGEVTGWTMPAADPASLAADWVTELDRHEISRAVLIASVPNDEASVSVAVHAHPDRFTGAFMFNPNAPDPETRAKRAFDEMGLKIACLFPAMHGYSVAESEGVRAVVALAAARPGTAVFVHCGTLSVGARKKLGAPSFFDMRRSNPLELARLAAEFSSARFIIPHFGAGMFRETMMVADLCPNVIIDTSSTNKWMNFEVAPIDLAIVFKRAINAVGYERLLFGTDSSFFPRGWHAAVFETQIKMLLEIGVEPVVAEAILGGNLRRVLGIE